MEAIRMFSHIATNSLSSNWKVLKNETAASDVHIVLKIWNYSSPHIYYTKYAFLKQLETTDALNRKGH